MEAHEMLDVLHYYLDEDMRYSSVEELKLHDAVRKGIFEDLYGIKYRYGMPENGSAEAVDGNGVKPYIPPTEFDDDAANPFGSVLDAPIA